eukprot:gene12311-13581_t
MDGLQALGSNGQFYDSEQSPRGGGEWGYERDSFKRREASLERQQADMATSHDLNAADDIRRSPERKLDRGHSRENRRYAPYSRDRGGSRSEQQRQARRVASRDCRVYVTNIPYELKWQELKDLMRKAGDVIYVEMVLDSQGKPRGNAVVEFAKPEDAEKAIREFDNHVILGRNLKLREDKVDDDHYQRQLKQQKESEQTRKSQMNNPVARSLNLLGNSAPLGLLSSKTSDSTDSTVFISNHPEIANIQFLLASSLSILFLFAVIVLFSPFDIDLLWLDYKVNWQNVKDVFRRAGNVVRVDIVEDDNKRSKGYGTVLFSSPMEALQADRDSNLARVVGLAPAGSQSNLAAQLAGQSNTGVQSGVNPMALLQLQSLMTLSALASGGLGNLNALTGAQGGGLSSSLGGGAGGNQTGLGGAGGINAATAAALSATVPGLGGLSSLLSNIGGAGALGQGAQGLSDASAGGGLMAGHGGGSSKYVGGIGGSGGRDDARRGRQIFVRNVSIDMVWYLRNGIDQLVASASAYYHADCVDDDYDDDILIVLPWKTTWQELKDRFRHIGYVLRVDLMTDERGRSRGMAKITFEHPDDAERAAVEMNGFNLDGRDIEVRMDRIEAKAIKLSGVMSEEDQDRLRNNAVPMHYKRARIPYGNPKQESSNILPDSMPLAGVVAKSENSFMQILDANRLSGVEPYQGDMLLDKVDMDQINQTREDEKARRTLTKEQFKERMAKASKRNIIRNQMKLWVTKQVPYEIDGSRAEARAMIEESMRDIENVSCLTFRAKKPGDRNWIRIYRGIGCFSDIGRSYMAGKPTSLSLGEMCLTKGLILHELMHALGFFHEQSRMDRDSFVKIFHENVRSGMEENFEKVESYEANVQDTDYDFNSIMQYGVTAFTVNGQDTMRDKFDESHELGSQALSKSDIIELNLAYQCHSKSKTWSDWSDWSPCARDWEQKCSHHKQRFCFSEDKSKCETADEFGVEMETSDCDEKECEKKIDGHWGVWGSWGTCSKTCDEGKRDRRRECDNPAPENGGKPCKGEGKDTDVCRLERCEKGKYDTNFEEGWGIWEQGTKDDFDWELGTGGTPTLRTGPKKDHTTGEGTYAFIEGSPPRWPDEIARLISKDIPAEFGDHCLTFYYIMKGKHIGYLDVHLKTASNEIMNLWRKNGHQGPDWYNAAVNLPDLEEPFKVVFEAKRGNGELSDIAIDDIYFDTNRCPLADQGCQDHNPSCPDWASVGECVRNKAWMNKNCCKACYEEGSCGNKNKKCSFWAKRAQCVNNKDWIMSKSAPTLRWLAEGRRMRSKQEMDEKELSTKLPKLQ